MADPGDEHEFSPVALSSHCGSVPALRQMGGAVQITFAVPHNLSGSPHGLSHSRHGRSPFHDAVQQTNRDA